MAKNKNIGWYVYLVECADGAFVGGIARDLKKEIEQINKEGKYRYYKKYEGKLPVKIIYYESDLSFREAYAKFSYLKCMNRRQRLMLLKKKRFNTSWILYMYGTRSKTGMYGYAINKT